MLALERIQKGSVDEQDYETVGDHWDIEKRIESALNQFNLWPVDIHHLFHTLSGGQKTKVLLAKTVIFPADILLFDEPTNNLDKESREILYRYVEESTKGIVIVSHDRDLLNRCDKIIEITTKGIEIFGGNYDFYNEQKKNKQQAIKQAIESRAQTLRKSKQTIQIRMERHQQNESRGRKEVKKQIQAKGSYDKIEMGGKKGRSQNTNRRIRLQAEHKLETVNENLSIARKELELHEELNIKLKETQGANSKTVLEITDLYFGYEKKPLLIHNFSLRMTGPERIALSGPNGCGKSTLIQLIRHLLLPQSGVITVDVERIAYLEQNISFLDPNLSLVENFLNLNPEAKPFDAYSALASFNFRNKDAEKKVKCLSGGERIRAGLAVSLMSSPAPQLLILDEPTNHLDLEAIEALESSLKLYQGAILAVSHDQRFLDNIGIQRHMTLHQNGETT